MSTKYSLLVGYGFGSIATPKMYQDAMRGVHAHLISRTRSNMTYTSELVLERKPDGEVYVVPHPLLSVDCD